MFFDHLPDLMQAPLFNLLFIMIVIWSAGVLLERFRLPLIAGELGAALLIGPALLNLVKDTPVLETLANLGMFFIMFYAGLETDPKGFRKIAKPSLGIGVVGTILPFLLGTAITLLFGGSIHQAVFVGIAISGTSLLIKVRVLGNLKILNSRLGGTIMEAAMVDNMFSLTILAIAIKALRMGELTFWGTALTVFEVVAFFGIALSIGYWILPRLGKLFVRREGKGFTFALIMGLLFAVLAEALRLHFIIGAYLAGLFAREEIMSASLLRKMNDRFLAIAHGFLGPLFVMSVAFKVDFSVFVTHFWFLITLFLGAFFGKMIGASLGGYWGGLKKEEAFSVGWGMNGLGMVELVLAMVGFELGVHSIPHFSALVFVVLASALLMPLGLRNNFKSLSR